MARTNRMKIPEPEEVLRERGVAPEGINPDELEKARFLHGRAEKYRGLPGDKDILAALLIGAPIGLALGMIPSKVMGLTGALLVCGLWACIVIKRGTLCIQSRRNYWTWLEKIEDEGKSFPQ